MSQCVYTRARVFVDDYQAHVIGDIHVINTVDGETAVINFIPESWNYNFDAERTGAFTHTVTLDSVGYMHKDKGVIVVPSAMLVGERR